MIRKTPAALDAVLRNALFIQEDSPDAAIRFLDSVESTLRLVVETPKIGRIHESQNSKLSGMRSVKVDGFPHHLIFYLEQADGILFVTLFHGARDLPYLLNSI